MQCRPPAGIVARLVCHIGPAGPGPVEIPIADMETEPLCQPQAQLNIKALQQQHSGSVAVCVVIAVPRWRSLEVLARPACSRMALVPPLTGMWCMRALTQPVNGLGNVLSRWHRLSCRQQHFSLGGGGAVVREHCLACRPSAASQPGQAGQAGQAVADCSWSAATCLEQSGASWRDRQILTSNWP